MDDPQSKHRTFLIEAEQKTQSAYDKAILTLSSGALGVSFVFVKELIRPGTPIVSQGLLYSAWTCWALSAASTLLSFYLSHRALRKAIVQFDRGEQERAGGRFAIVTEIANLTAGLLFCIGVFLMIVFVGQNLRLS